MKNEKLVFCLKGGGNILPSCRVSYITFSLCCASQIFGFFLQTINLNRNRPCLCHSGHFLLILICLWRVWSMSPFIRSYGLLNIWSSRSVSIRTSNSSRRQVCRSRVLRPQSIAVDLYIDLYLDRSIKISYWVSNFCNFFPFCRIPRVIDQVCFGNSDLLVHYW